MNAFVVREGLRGLWVEVIGLYGVAEGWAAGVLNFWFFVTFGAKIKANQLNINWLALLFRIFFRNLKC